MMEEVGKKLHIHNIIDMGRKIHSSMENPIDDVIVDSICEPLSNILRAISEKITPNMITFVGMIIGIMCVWSIYKGFYKMGFILYWICYIFDCLDGYYARKYNMITRFGDFFDHFRDLFVNFFIIVLIFRRIKLPVTRDVYIISLIIIFIGLLTHFGAQELNSKSPTHNECLQMLTPLCKHPEYIHYTKYMGNGTFVLIISLYIIALDLNL